MNSVFTRQPPQKVLVFGLSQPFPGVPSNGDGGGLTNFADTLDIVEPNDVIPVACLTPSGAEPSIDIALVPKGSGSIIASVPVFGDVGNNKRGRRSVDLQMLRDSSAQVASGEISVISGGRANTASGYCSTVSGGYYNIASGQSSFIGGGSYHTVSGYSNSTIVGGYSNEVSGSYAFIGSGYNNTASGQYSAILAGRENLASGLGSSVISGRYNVASGQDSIASGSGADNRGVYGAIAHRTLAMDASPHRMQIQVFGQSVNANPILCTAWGAGFPASSTSLVIPNNTASILTVYCLAASYSGNVYSTTLTATVKRGDGANTIQIVGAVTNYPNGATGGFSPSFTLVADTTLGAIHVQYTGVAATNTCASAEIVSREMFYSF